MDPLSDIENEQAQRDIGVFASRVYRGARSDDCSIAEALFTTTAWYLAMFKSNESPSE